MKRMHGPSLLLGLGMGLVLAALLGVVISPLLPPSGSDAAVLRRAAALGMVMESRSNVDGITSTPDGQWRIELPSDLDMADLAERLVKAGILEDTLEFEILARKEGLSQTVKAGVYLLPADSRVRDVIGVFLAGPAS